MLTRFFVIVLLAVGAGVFVIEYTRDRETVQATAPAQLTDVNADDVLYNGVWTAKEHDASGTWRIIQIDGKIFVALDEEFSTRNAPDLNLFLSPKPLAELNGANAAEGALFIGQLQSNKGAQRYEISSETNLMDYETIIIHCQQFSKLWSGATLK